MTDKMIEMAERLCGIGTAIREGRADHMGDDYADALDEAATLLERLSSSEVTEEWLPIASAPKDGERILLAPHMMTGWWEFGDNEWMVLAIPLNEDRSIADDWTIQPKLFFCLYAQQFGVEPTHWRPLPEPPRSAATSEPKEQHP